ncbi:hypothetical protein LTR53_017447, partial [Teratosphaeriaceae sp. CCFEE 6253]
MRLLDTGENEYQLQTFLSTPRPDYAILSHRWSEDEPEVTYEQLTAWTDRTRRPISYGWTKVFAACEIARSRNIRWVWIDTCCIDKRSSAELSEAINSMYAWYQESTECYAFLDDVPPPAEASGTRADVDVDAFCRSKWFKRGWTLQELLAPEIVLFYGKAGQDRRPIGTRERLCGHISRTTGIGQDYLASSDNNASRLPVRSASVAQRMSWASRRTTTKTEDVAYSLLGLFDVNMPLLYGEGERAFARLQLEIIAQSTDDSIFAWDIGQSNQLSGMLAHLPRDFQRSGDVVNKPEPGQATSQANLNAVVHTSTMPLSAVIAYCLFGVAHFAQDTIRLRCVRDDGKTSAALWLSLRREPDGKYYRTALATRSTRWLGVVSITIQQFIRYPRHVSISSRPAPDPGDAEAGRVQTKHWWDYIPASTLLRIVAALRILAIVAITWIGVTGQTTCS